MAPEPFELRLRPALCRQSRDLFFQPLPHLPEFEQGVFFHVEQKRQTLAHRGKIGVEREVAQKSALAAPHLYQARGVEGAQGFPHRGAADAERGREFALRRQPVAGRELALADELLYLLHHVFVEPCFSHRPEQGTAS